MFVPILNISGVIIIFQMIRISKDELRPGDIVFFTGTYDAGRPVTHVGIYVGDGTMIHAGDPVQYANLNSNYWKNHYYGAGRVIP